MEKISKETNIKKKLFTHEKFLILCSYQFGGVPEWPKGSDCKSDGTAFEGSNPSPTTIFKWLNSSTRYKFCGHRIMAITSAFQADDAGSIPAARSNSHSPYPFYFT